MLKFSGITPEPETTEMINPWELEAALENEFATPVRYRTGHELTYSVSPSSRSS